MSGRDSVCQILVVAIFVIGTTLGATALVALTSSTAESWTVVRGTGAASDGLITITMGASRLVSVPTLNDGEAPSVFLLVNLTFANVGSGNTTTNAGWFVNVTWNGTEFSNTWFQFTGPDAAGQLPIPYPIGPGQHISGWLAFYVATLPDASAKTLASLHIEKLTYNETSYGGQYVGDGGWTEVSSQLRVRFEITPA